MVKVAFDTVFKRRVKKIKDKALKERVKKQIAKILANPGIGKPMRFSRKGTREVYVAPFRLSYLYVPSKDTVVFLDLYHKDKQ
ncbi:MAG: type II toxin-antitoxin system RelE/ParE family toxin [Candidatus Diapherotrites archaeon]|nr:type II toxin-antitoxin system RelE/ParE family toxin [Candidatus Diapherotrites archaeon]